LVLTMASKPAQGRGKDGIAGGMQMPSLPWVQNRWMPRTCIGDRHMVFARTGDGQESDMFDTCDASPAELIIADA
jgi:hypothetical protein